MILFSVISSVDLHDGLLVKANRLAEQSLVSSNFYYLIKFVTFYCLIVNMYFYKAKKDI